MGLILPPGHAIHNTPPTKLCTICDWAGWTQRELEAHVMHHVKHDMESILEHSPKHTAPGFFDNDDPRYNDVDWAKWIEKNHRERPEQWRDWMKTGLDK